MQIHEEINPAEICPETESLFGVPITLQHLQMIKQVGDVFDEDRREIHYNNPGNWDRFKSLVIRSNDALFRDDTQEAYINLYQAEKNALYALEPVEDSEDLKEYNDLFRCLARIHMEMGIVHRVAGNVYKEEDLDQDLATVYFEKALEDAVYFGDIPLFIELQRHWVNLNISQEKFDDAVVRAFTALTIAASDKVKREGDSSWFAKGLVIAIKNNPNVPISELIFFAAKNGYFRTGLKNYITKK